MLRLASDYFHLVHHSMMTMMAFELFRWLRPVHLMLPFDYFQYFHYFHQAVHYFRLVYRHPLHEQFDFALVVDVHEDFFGGFDTFNRQFCLIS